MNITCYRGRHRYLPTLPRREPRRLRAAPLLLLRPLRVGPDRSAVRGPQPPRRLGRRLRRRRRALARHARRLRLPRLLPLGLRLRLARGRARTARRPTSALEQVDAAIGALLDAAGGPDEFLERYAVVLLSDHGQTAVERAARLEEPLRRSRRTGRRDRLEPRRAGLPPPGRAGRRRPSWRGGSTASPRSTSRSASRGTRSSRAGTARTPRSRSSSIPTRRGARARRSRTRTPASCSSPRPRAGSSPTSAAAITRAAAATARSSRATRSSRS